MAQEPEISAAEDTREERPVEADQPEAEGETEGTSTIADVPEMMELIDGIEENQADPVALATVIRNIGRRCRLSPGDRELLSDFEGIAALGKVLALKPHEWRGEAMMALCSALPDICRTSTVNRGALRDEGFVDAVVELLRTGVQTEKEELISAASSALIALCTANDGNKKAAAQLRGEFNEEELVKTDANDPRVPLFKAPDKAGALDLLLNALADFPEHVMLQTNGIGAVRCLLSDDDTRQASCVPSAVENRERAVTDEHFPRYRVVVERGLRLGAGDINGAAAPVVAPASQLQRLREQAMLLLKELSCRQDRIHQLVFESKLLPHMERSLKDADERLVRAGLAVIRAFAFSDELKEKLAVGSDIALRCVAAVRQHVNNPAICEQGFGLFANLTMRKPHIATRLNGPDFRVFALGQIVMNKHAQRPGVIRSVLQTMRNVATQDETAGLEVREGGAELIAEMRRLVADKRGDDTWRSPVEISRQFLRELRADDGLRANAQYNDYY